MVSSQLIQNLKKIKKQNKKRDSTCSRCQARYVLLIAFLDDPGNYDRVAELYKKHCGHDIPTTQSDSNVGWLKLFQCADQAYRLRKAQPNIASYIMDVDKVNTFMSDVEFLCGELGKVGIFEKSAKRAIYALEPPAQMIIDSTLLITTMAISALHDCLRGVQTNLYTAPNYIHTLCKTCLAGQSEHSRTQPHGTVAFLS